MWSETSYQSSLAQLAISLLPIQMCIIYNGHVLNGKTVALVIKCYNEEKQILKVLKNVPDFADKIVVVNDKSTDNTAKVVADYIANNHQVSHTVSHEERALKDDGYDNAEKALRALKNLEAKKFAPYEIYNKNKLTDRVVLINHLENGGPGAAVATGYKWCRDSQMGCTVVVDGDGQMDLSELEAMCLPVVNGEADYTKANRLKHRSALLVMPKVRFFGNSVLSLLTKVASGYWYVTDTQAGFTAISLEALEGIRLHQLYKLYGYPNDMLVKLNISGATIKEIRSKPVYNVGEESNMVVFKVIPKISWLLFRSFWVRLYKKYLFRDFHPLFLLYHFSMALFLVDVFVFKHMLDQISDGRSVTFQSLVVFVFLAISAFQSFIFAMWMDMMDNDRLYKS